MRPTRLTAFRIKLWSLARNFLLQLNIKTKGMFMAKVDITGNGPFSLTVAEGITISGELETLGKIKRQFVDAPQATASNASAVGEQPGRNRRENSPQTSPILQGRYVNRHPEVQVSEGLNARHIEAEVGRAFRHSGAQLGRIRRSKVSVEAHGDGYRVAFHRHGGSALGDVIAVGATPLAAVQASFVSAVALKRAHSENKRNIQVGRRASESDKSKLLNGQDSEFKVVSEAVWDTVSRQSAVTRAAESKTQKAQQEDIAWAQHSSPDVVTVMQAKAEKHERLEMRKPKRDVQQTAATAPAPIKGQVVRFARPAIQQVIGRKNGHAPKIPSVQTVAPRSVARSARRHTAG
jgi:hypothetical protein